MNVDRQDLLNQLEMVAPGLSQRDIIEQSSCFVFAKGRVITYNDEVACSHPTKLDIHGAVVSQRLLALLRKLKHPEIQVTTSNGELMIKRKNGVSKLRMEEEILLPYKSVEKPKEWHDLPTNFLEGIQITKACASTDQSMFVLTCLLMTPLFVDACDRQQACRYFMKLPVEDRFLIRRESVTYLTTMDVSQMAETKNWVHFKNDSGLVISCRRYSNIEEFHSLDNIVKPVGKKLVMPKSMKDAIETSDIFVGEGPGEDGRVRVSLKPNKIHITGVCLEGSNKEVRKAKYKGPEIDFVISARLLSEFSEKFQKCLVSKKKLCVATDQFSYATSIGLKKGKKK